MYKTVRHGENSLQYKILAQQEEGVVNVKCRKSPRTVTAKLITVIILLIIGIIASAVLVPLVLTNDFIALTGTFQKFSVSTLRRSHSGNHVVVIAKKPYGWNGPHSSLPSRPSNSSRSQPNEFTKATAATEAAPTAAQPTATTRRTTTPPPEAPPNALAPHWPGPTRPKTTTDAAEADVGPDAPTARLPQQTTKARGPAGPAPTVVHREKGTPGGTGGPEGAERAPSTAAPAWFEPVNKWGLGSSDGFLRGMDGTMNSAMSVMGSFLFVAIVFTMLFILRKTLAKRRTLSEIKRDHPAPPPTAPHGPPRPLTAPDADDGRGPLLKRNRFFQERADSKEDKARLLKPSSDHDE